VRAVLGYNAIKWSSEYRAASLDKLLKALIFI
jgi:hypothetical protein